VAVALARQGLTALTIGGSRCRSARRGRGVVPGLACTARRTRRGPCN
jgi:hypothetical protein